jgi:hypothetical protein
VIAGQWGWPGQPGWPGSRGRPSVVLLARNGYVPAPGGREPGHHVGLDLSRKPAVIKTLMSITLLSQGKGASRSFNLTPCKLPGGSRVDIWDLYSAVSAGSRWLPGHSANGNPNPRQRYSAMPRPRSSCVGARY